MEKVTKTRKPLISVIMPVRNAGAFLVESIESIRNQTYQNWEFVIIDDASCDTTPDILKQYVKKDKRITVIRNEVNKGISHSLNTALQLARGEFIARMDGDDISKKDRFEKQLTFLQKNPYVIAVGGQAEMIDEKGVVFAYKRFPANPHMLYRMIMRAVPIQHPILMARAGIFKKYRYDETLKTAEDVDMLFYLLSQGIISNVDDYIYRYRKTDMNNGHHNVKKTFEITFKSRFESMRKYGYTPNAVDLLITFIQYALVMVLPAKLVVGLFEALRLQSAPWEQAGKIRQHTFYYGLSMIDTYTARLASIAKGFRKANIKQQDLRKAKI